MSTGDPARALFRGGAEDIVGQPAQAAFTDSAFADTAFVHADWRKSSRSGNGSDGNCVEVAFAGPAVAVRDSKNPTGSVLAVPLPAWTAFAGAACTGEFG